MGADRQAARGGFHVADGEWNGGGRGVFVRGLIFDAGDGGGGIYRVDGQNERTAGGRSFRIGDRDGDGGRAVLVGHRRDGHASVGPAATHGDVSVGNQRWIGGAAGNNEIRCRCLAIIDSECDSGQRRVFVGCPGGDAGNGRGSIRHIQNIVQNDSADRTTHAVHRDVIHRVLRCLKYHLAGPAVRPAVIVASDRNQTLKVGPRPRVYCQHSVKVASFRINDQQTIGGRLVRVPFGRAAGLTAMIRFTRIFGGT